MTPEAQQKAIEEACGVMGCTPKADMDRMLASLNAEERINAFAHIPSKDYLNDLNAIHEAEKTIPVTQHDLWWRTLACVVTGFTLYEFDQSNEYSCAEIAHASASQRAEAFLRTIDKWVEE